MGVVSLRRRETRSDGSYSVSLTATETSSSRWLVELRRVRKAHSMLREAGGSTPRADEQEKTAPSAARFTSVAVAGAVVAAEAVVAVGFRLAAEALREGG
jgi:hypothetical protein